MAEIASAYPTAGGLYYWASRMRNKNWGWWTAWLNLLGQFAIVAGINYAAAAFLNATIITPVLANFGITYGNTTESIPDLTERASRDDGHPDAHRARLNIAGINLVAMLNQVSVWWHIGLVAAVVVLVFLAGQADAVRPHALRGRTAGRRRELEQRPRLRQPDVRAGRVLSVRSWRSSSRSSRRTGRIPAMTPRPTWPRRPSAPASRARGASSCRSRCARSSGTSSSFALTTHLPDLSTLFPADLDARRPNTPASTTSAAASPSSTILGLQPRPASAASWRRDRHRDGVLRPLLGRLGRPDAVRVQPR